MSPLRSRLLPRIDAERLRAAYRYVRALPHHGRAVECPLCRGTFRRFLPAGRPPRPHALCPRCGTLERHRLLWRYLAERTRLLSSPLRLLHVAPEPALERALRRVPGLEYISADFETPGVDLRLDLTALPFADASIDAILCSHVLEHVPDDRAAMREMRRVLAPDGWAILVVPVDESRETTYEDPSITDPAARERAFGQSDHVRWYGRDYADRLREAGFAVEEDRFGVTMPERERERFGIAAETLPICRPG